MPSALDASLQHRIVSKADARAAAVGLAEEWQRGAPARDADPWVRDGALEALARSGLLGVFVVEESAASIADVVRILATGDPALAQQLHGHIGNLLILATGPAPVRERISRAVLEQGARFGNTNRDRDPRVATTLVPDGDGFRLDGVKAYCTGAVEADWLAVPGTLPDGELRVALVPAGADGVEVGTTWDALGQRATRSVTTRFSSVRVAADHVLDPWSDPIAAFVRELRSQLPHPALEVGIAEAVLAEPWPEDVRRLEAFAAVAAHVAAARALLDDVARRIDALGDRPDVRAVADAALALFAARALSYRTSVRTADAATRWADGELAARVELHWRNARTHSVHDPGRWAFHHIGRHVLTGRYPAPRSPGLRAWAAELVPEPREAPVVPAAPVPAALVGAAAAADAARAALTEAARFVAGRPHAWPEAGVERAADEPHAILRFGELAVSLWALDALIARGDAAAGLYADQVALRIVSDALEIAGASALSRELGLDRHRRTVIAALRSN